MRRINISTPKYKNSFAIIDDEDFKCLDQWKWRKHTCGYAVRNIYIDKKKKIVFMHRFLINPGKLKIVDHINRNKLDNRKSNLRTCNYSENGSNRIKTSIRKTSIYKGVVKRGDRWEASIKKDGKLTYLGLFDTEKTAGLAYDSASKVMFNGFECTNFK